MKWVFATGNKHKVQEIRPLLPDGMELLSLRDIGCDEDLPETGSTIAANSLEKAVYVREKYGYPCFAEDSGLVVPAIDGEPGVYSARYAGTGDAGDNIIKLLARMRGVDDRRAYFVTVFTLAGDGSLEQFEGRADGEITLIPAGEGGFGYDPVFRPKGHDRTFAEMLPDEKREISNRSKAFAQLLIRLKSFENSNKL